VVVNISRTCPKVHNSSLASPFTAFRIVDDPLPGAPDSLIASEMTLLTPQLCHGDAGTKNYTMKAFVAGRLFSSEMTSQSSLKN